MGDLLRREGFEVEYCHLPLWGSDRYSIMGRSKFRLALRALRIYASLAWRLTRTPRPAAYVVLYPGQFDIPVVSTVARVQHVPVLFDMFISMYDTVVQDRKLADPNSAIARLTKFADRVACRFSDLVLVDTPEDAEYFSELTGVGKERFRLLWVGAPEDVFRPLSGVEPETNLVLFYGTFIALQGTDTIVRAAKLLEDDGITIRMIGKGQERPAAEELQRRLGVSNLEFVDPVPLEELPGEIARAALCLGIFGTTPKASRVIPNKVFQCAAVGRPILTGDTPAIRTGFGDAVAVVSPGDPVKLADAIRSLLGSTHELDRLAAGARSRFESDYSAAALGLKLRGYLEELIDKPAASSAQPSPLG